jgi:phosphoribosylformylglycinamidine synthase subunit PurS
MSDQPASDRPVPAGASPAFRFAVHVMPKAGILDPQGRAVERSMPHLGVTEVRDVRVGRRVELTVQAADEAAARAIVERLANELLANPLIESYAVTLIGAVAGGAGAVTATGGATATGAGPEGGA